MKILLVKPAFARLLDNTVYLTYPIGLMYVAAMLRDRGHDVRIWHDDVSNAGPIASHPAAFQPMRAVPPGPEILNPLADYMDEWQPHVVGVGYNTIDWLGAHAVAALANERGIRTVAGGIHPSLLPYDEMKPKGPFDGIVVGDGDHYGVESAFTWDVFPDSPGCRSPTVFESSVDGNGSEFSCFHTLHPARDAVIGWERYHPYLRGIIQTQRGCPYNCGYCAAPTVFGRKVRTRDPQHVRAEVDALGVSSGRIIDDSFFVHKQHARDVCNELHSADYTWVCDTAIQDATDDALDHVAWGGCYCINCGIESATERWRELSGKRVAEGAPEDLLRRANERGLDVHYYFMVGFPGETYDEMQATLDWAEKLRDWGAVPCISIVTPYPKTRLWDACVEWRSLGDSDWSVFLHQNSSVKLADCSTTEWDQVVERGTEINP